MRTAGRNEEKYKTLVRHYEACFRRHGDTCRGMDWPTEEGAQRRYRTMLEVVRPRGDSRVSLLDFGCGTSHLFEYMKRHRIDGIDYAGLDLSETFVRVSREKFPGNVYYHLDVLKQPDDLPKFDYIVMNGVFTEKGKLTFVEMFAYFRKVISVVFGKCRCGIAFNVMSKQVDWERDDLFHLPMDDLASFLVREVSRNFVIRHEYGLYEYSTYVYK